MFVVVVVRAGFHCVVFSASRLVEGFYWQSVGACDVVCVVKSGDQAYRQRKAGGWAAGKTPQVSKWFDKPPTPSSVCRWRLVPDPDVGVLTMAFE